MVGLVIVALWFGVVAAYLVRQWWVSELAQPGAGVDAAAPAPLPVAPRPAGTPLFGFQARVAGSAAR